MLPIFAGNRPVGDNVVEIRRRGRAGKPQEIDLNTGRTLRKYRGGRAFGVTHQIDDDIDFSVVDQLSDLLRASIPHIDKMFESRFKPVTANRFRHAARWKLQSPRTGPGHAVRTFQPQEA